MPNPIVWLNDTIAEGSSSILGASQVTAGPDGRYSNVGHFLGGIDAISGAVYGADGNALNAPFILDPADPVNFPDVSYLPDGRIVMAWTQTTGGNQDIYFKVINGQAQGYTPFSPAPILANSGAVAANQTRPIVTGLANGNIALSWFDGNDNHQKVRVFDILGNPVSGVIDASPVNGANAAFALNSSATLIPLDNGGFAVGFVDLSGESRMSVFNASGAVTASEIDLIVGGGNDDFGQPTLSQLADGRIVAVSSIFSGTGLVVRFFSEAGAALTAEIAIALPGVDAGEDEAPRIAALNDGRFMVVFGRVEGTVDSDIWGVIIRADGTVDGTPFRVNDTAGPGTGSQSAPSIATLADGRVVVSWTDSNTGNGDIVQKIYDPRETGLSGSASGMSDDWHGTGFADTIYMGLGNDLFHGAAGNDFVYGEGGNDTLYGGDGADYIRGGNGNDIIWGADGLNALTDTGDVWLSGEGGNDTIYGEAGDDRIDGGDGFDQLYGGAGRDYVTAGAGNDTIYGGNEAGAGDRWLGGEGGDDAIDGGDGDDRIDGGDGIDQLLGNNGNDYITAGAGADTIYGGNEAVGGDAYLAGDAGIDTINGEDGNDRIDGGTEGDFLYGGNGQDTITGAAGDDLIEGGAATDGLYGGAGADTFDYNAGCGTDNIYDFADDVDTIRIDPSFGLSVAQVLAATSIFGNHAYINLGGGNGMIVLNWISTGHVIEQLGDDIVIV